MSWPARLLQGVLHIGVAVDTDQGLIVPVLRDVDKKNILALSSELNAVATKTRDRKNFVGRITRRHIYHSIRVALVRPFYSHHQSSGNGHPRPGPGKMKPVVRDGKIEPRLMLPMALSYDHRVIDGAPAVRFMLDLVKGFESFDDKRMES